MLRRCWLVPTYHGGAVFVDREKALSYAVKWHSYVVNMIGQDNTTTPGSPPVAVVPGIGSNDVVVDVDITTQVVGS